MTLAKTLTALNKESLEVRHEVDYMREQLAYVDAALTNSERVTSNARFDFPVDTTPLNEAIARRDNLLMRARREGADDVQILNAAVGQDDYTP